MKATIISIDDIKEKIEGYDPEKAEDVHKQSAKLANQEFTKALKDSGAKKVILLSGGSASGKTEYMMTYLVNENSIIFDSTLPSVEGAKIKIKECLKYKKDIEIHLVIPDSLSRAFVAFLNRDRKFSEDVFYRTHSGSRETVLWIAENHPKIKIVAIISSYINKKMGYKEKIFKNNSELVEYLKSIQYNETEIKNITIYDREKT